jgi:2-oxoglutarate dehydrogenase E2 component (dihydrolipoamide succinyltransferase)
MFELTMPKMGESVAEATITQWLKNEGDAIALDESVLTIATDKVDSDIPSPVAGVLVKKLFNENDVIQVGQVIAHIETGTAQPAASNAQPAASSPQPAAGTAQPETSSPKPEARNQEPAASSQAPVAKGSGSRFYSPLVRSMAAPSAMRRSASPRLRQPQTNGTLKSCL